MPTRPARPAPDPSEALAALGFSPLEAEVYAFLARHSPATGYRVAQALGKPVGNIYKAIESLETRGAVVTSEDEGNRLARAAPPGDLLNAARRRLDQIAPALDTLGEDADGEPDDLLYRVSDREGTLQRARALLKDATSFALAIVTPRLVDEIASDLVRAAARVRVAVKVFAPVDLPGVEVVVDPRGEDAVARAPGEYLGVIADGRCFLNALFDERGDGLRTGHTTANPLLNWTYYTGISSDILLAAVRQAIARGASLDELRDALRLLSRFESPTSGGKDLLIRRYRTPSQSTRGRPRATPD